MKQLLMSLLVVGLVFGACTACQKSSDKDNNKKEKSK